MTNNPIKKLANSFSSALIPFTPKRVGSTHLHESQVIVSMITDLTAPAPHSLQETILLCQPVQRIVALAHGAYEAAKSISLVLARVSSILVHEADGKLHRGVVLSFDDAVRC
jgi:hypothetical protein